MNKKEREAAWREKRKRYWEEADWRIEQAKQLVEDYRQQRIKELYQEWHTYWADDTGTVPRPKIPIPGCCNYKGKIRI